MKNGQKDLTLLPLKIEDESIRYGKLVPSRKWKRQGNEFTPKLSERNIALLTT